MARISVYIISALSLVIIGLAPCQSSQCDSSTLDNLVEGSCTHPISKWCRDDVGILRCLKQFKEDCKGSSDELIEGITSAIEEKEEDVKMRCKNLDLSKTCFYQELENCLKPLPKYYWSIPKRKDVTQLCQQFKGKGSVAKKCLETLLGKCPDRSIRIHPKIKEIQAAINKCG